MAKWKVVVDPTYKANMFPMMRSALAGPAPPRVTHVLVGGTAVRTIRIHGLLAMANVKWDDIPAAVKVENMHGFRFVRIRPDVKLEDFDIEETDA